MVKCDGNKIMIKIY